jgi:hypothetical protein
LAVWTIGAVRKDGILDRGPTVLSEAHGIERESVLMTLPKPVFSCSNARAARPFGLRKTSTIKLVMIASGTEVQYLRLSVLR